MTAEQVHDALAQATADRPRGWGRPVGRRAAHLYEAGDILSLCGQALFFGAVEAGPGGRPRCWACRQKLGEGQ